MTRIVSPAQSRALEVVVDMIDRLTSNGDDNQLKFGRNIMDLILGILNVDVNDTIKTIPNDNDELQIIIPDWIKEKQTPPFSPHTPFPPQVWYNQETEPKQPTAQELRYATEVSCTGDKNGIVYVSNTADVDVQYNGDFRDTQTSFNDK